MRTRSARNCAATTSTRSRKTRSRFSYKEDPSDESSSESAEEVSDAVPRGVRNAELQASKLKSARSVSRKRKALQSKLGRPPLAKKSKPTSNSRPAVTIRGKPTDAVSPKWYNLPYEILLQIFQYASYPLYDDQYQPNPSAQWLLKTALLCKSFAEPALTALYYAPPLSPPSRVRALMEQLASQKESATFDYRSKIKYLDLEATSTLRHRYAGREPINMAELVALTPQLRGIGIHLMSDWHKYNPTLAVIRRKQDIMYKKSLFDALECNKIFLREWKWNFDAYHVDHKHDPFPWSSLSHIHSSASFRNLRSLEIFWYNSYHKGMTELNLAAAINALPSLRRLSFRISYVGNTTLLPLLPWNLQSLCFWDCPDLTSETLSLFLSTHGGNLRELILDHNRALNLGFLVNLARACPKVERLKMNLTYFHSSTVRSDTEPNFEFLLQADEVPSWPSSLQYIELLHLRKWQTNGAQTLFKSLLDSAATLPHLRTLIVKASIQIGWRDRASFRDQWIGQLKRVFLRECPPPNPWSGFLVNPKKQNSDVENGKEQSVPSDTSEQARSRRSSLRPRHSNNPLPDKHLRESLDSETDSDAPILHVNSRRSKRLKEQDVDFAVPAAPKGDVRVLRRRGRPRKSASTEESAEDRNEDEVNGLKREDSEEDIFVQGLCNIVEIRIDNLRPAENQFDENDFLDEEVSGDEDWNGEDVPMSDTVHAW